MPVIEVDEAEFKRLDGIRQTVAKMATHADAKKLLQKAHKLVDPNAVTPELDEDEAKSKVTEGWEKKFNDLQAKIDADKAEREKNEALSAANLRWEAGRKTLRDAGWTKEGIEGVEKLMEERGIADHEIAAAYIERQNPPPEVLSPRGFGSFNFIEPPAEDDKFVKALLDTRGEADGAVLKAASEAIAEVRGNTRR